MFIRIRLLYSSLRVFGVGKKGKEKGDGEGGGEEFVYTGQLSIWLGIGNCVYIRNP